MRRLSLFVAGAALATLVGASPVLAGPPADPTRGTLEPATDACPWPDFYNAITTTLKCLPTMIPWSEVEHDGIVSSGVRIVADPLTAMDGSGAAGWVTFWCQFRAGLNYQIRVTGLTPGTTYSVHATGGGFVEGAGPVTVHEVLGTLRSDANGRGVLNGLLRLEKGGYELDITVSNGSIDVVSVPDDDLLGFAIL